MRAPLRFTPVAVGAPLDLGDLLISVGEEIDDELGYGAETVWCRRTSVGGG